MKKKVLFCIRDFAHGGIPKCLQQLLMLIDTSKYEVDLFCGNQDGIYKGQMPNCNVISQDWLFWAFMTNYHKQKGWRRSLAIAVKSVRHILNKLGFDWYEYHIRKTAKHLENKKYDTYVAYMGGLVAQLCSYVNSDNKIVWIHMDCESEHMDSKDFLFFYFFERIVSVSMAAKDSFCHKCPTLAPKTTSINNLLNIEDVKSKSLALPILDKQNALLFNNDTFSIISVGRVCAVKQFFFIPQIASELFKKGLDFKWYIIGGGPDMEVQLVQDSIVKYKVEENVVLLGPSSNPYPYIKKSDLLVLLNDYPQLVAILIP